MTAGFKSGANNRDTNKIKALMFEGYDSTEISNMLMIEEECVASFMDHFEAQEGGGEPEELPVEAGSADDPNPEAAGNEPHKGPKRAKRVRATRQPAPADDDGPQPGAPPGVET